MVIKKQNKQTGPEPDHLKLDDDWRSAMEKALKKEKPKEGWPEKPTDKGSETED